MMHCDTLFFNDKIAHPSVAIVSKKTGVVFFVLEIQMLDFHFGVECFMFLLVGVFDKKMFVTCTWCLA